MERDQKDAQEKELPSVSLLPRLPRDNTEFDIAANNFAEELGDKIGIEIESQSVCNFWGYLESPNDQIVAQFLVIFHTYGKKVFVFSSNSDNGTHCKTIYKDQTPEEIAEDIFDGIMNGGTTDIEETPLRKKDCFGFPEITHPGSLWYKRNIPELLAEVTEAGLLASLAIGCEEPLEEIDRRYRKESPKSLDYGPFTERSHNIWPCVHR